ncbi:hypothetical protein BDV12DRAFT_204014 [Aspergillus spectabilis]
MPYSLAGRRVLITGGTTGLGKVVSARFAAQGAHIAVNYASNKTAASAAVTSLQAEFGVTVVAIQGNVGVAEECENIVQTAIHKLGGLDIVIANAAWTKFSNFADLSALSEAEWDKCWATNVKSSLHIFRAASETLNANADGGAFIYTASIAGVSPCGSSLAYAVTKAAGLHLMKCLALTQGPKIRVNSVVPGLLLTDWGNQYSPDYVQRWREETALRDVPGIHECAEVYLNIAQNLSMSGQQIEIDCGWLLNH